MSRQYKLRAEYPLHGADDGLPVVITFNHTKGRPMRWYLRNGDPGHPAEPDTVDLHAVEPADGCDLPVIIRQAMWCWAADYLMSDEGELHALNAVDEAMEAQS